MFQRVFFFKNHGIATTRNKKKELHLAPLTSLNQCFLRKRIILLKVKSIDQPSEFWQHLNRKAQF